MKQKQARTRASQGTGLPRNTLVATLPTILPTKWQLGRPTSLLEGTGVGAQGLPNDENLAGGPNDKQNVTNDKQILVAWRKGGSER